MRTVCRLTPSALEIAKVPIPRACSLGIMDRCAIVSLCRFDRLRMRGVAALLLLVIVFLLIEGSPLDQEAPGSEQSAATAAQTASTIAFRRRSRHAVRPAACCSSRVSAHRLVPGMTCASR